jgi:hypothetical protein
MVLFIQVVTEIFCVLKSHNTCALLPDMSVPTIYLNSMCILVSSNYNE